jgi:hypothetical protein
MILHAASIAAFFVDQLAQAPVQIQCVQQSTPSPEWRWWMGALALWVGPILSTAGSIYVAWRVFRWQSTKDKSQWLLENKKTEWRALLELASKVEHFMPSVGEGGESISAVHDPSFRQHLRDMTETVLKCVFISRAKAEKIYNILLNVQLINEESKGHIEDHSSNAAMAAQLGKPRPLQAAQNVRSELISLWREIRNLAAEDLNPEYSERWWKSLVIWRKRQRPGAPL